MSLKVSIYSDYVCPFCFIGKDQFEKAITETDAEVSIEWKTFELRPQPLAQLDPINDSSKLALWQQAINPRIEAWDVNMKLPNVSPHPYIPIWHMKACILHKSMVKRMTTIIVFMKHFSKKIKILEQ